MFNDKKLYIFFFSGLVVSIYSNK